MAEIPRVEQFDVTIIGAGIHGVGVAQAAAARGYKTLVVEQKDLAFGTSRRSSKLIHGGLRYLESLQFGLVKECLNERKILLQIAPELVKLKPFYLPIYHQSVRRPYQIRIGLSLYSVLGGLSKQTQFNRIPKASWADALDGLRTDGLKAVFQYWDAQTDDAALTRAVMASAEKFGAELRLPFELRSATKTGDGYRLIIINEGRELEFDTKVLINAAGPWAAEILSRILPTQQIPDHQLVQGTHIIVSGNLSQGLYYVEAPEDKRAVFVMPWQGNTLVGTTETEISKLPDACEPLPSEIQYLSDVLHYYFPRYGHAPDILDAFAGLRVLPGKEDSAARAFNKPRETRLVVDDLQSPRLLSIFGGKLTAYRATAQKVMNTIQSSLPPRQNRADTAVLPLNPVD